MTFNKTNTIKTQALIIGSGLAGSTAALILADKGLEVTLITSEKELLSGNSPLAQGGIVYKAAKENPKELEGDILNAGHNLNNHWAVRHLARKGPEIVDKILIDRLKIPFAKIKSDNAANAWDLAREGGHHSPCILHCADYTGLAIMQGVTKAVASHPNIKVLTQHTAIDLLTIHHHSQSKTYRYQVINKCCGAHVFDENNSTVQTILADVTILASGGAGQIFLHTTNNPSVIGSAFAMASRALVRMTNLEYVQFHPTAFFDHAPSRFLITEAMRGEGARLINAKGERFMKKYDQREELAPRDIVSQAIVNELLTSGSPCVFLDTKTLKTDPKERFPTIYEHCLKSGIDIRKEPIPVVPAAHYFCGGILTNLWGETSLNNLYSIGECSCTGLHGANRLASTSLLEALVWGYQAAEHINKNITSLRLSNRLLESISDWKYIGNEKNDDPALIAQDWTTIRSTTWNYVGIIRSHARLRRAFEELRDLSTHVHDFYKLTTINKSLIDLFHGCQSAYVLTQAAMRNPKKLGCHNMID
ncbi:L-aspartate oxidase [Desulfovibrio litoralis]|uniref:L-aspartate oxidase n=1 Tax=Desulfovibrio litoralis DSM 11393 TaxID=1121455 RepID=A0A1M7SNI9_9BACT|nr:FAD-binding protein [Desulfovibrio litoralis]SHN60057.1 L-aspartate oxidase [Desulfovibrio litoralis DSM 11393]